MGCCGSKKEKLTNKVQENQPLDQIKSSQVIVQTNKAGTKRDYKKGDLIGTGAFSEVYQALDNKTGKLLAIKTVKLQGGKDEILRTIIALKAEIKLLKKLQHKNIIKYYFTEISPNQSYVDIALEYIAQGSLRKVINKVRLDEANVRIYARQILEGIQYLHQNKVIHRDIKAANILVDSDGTIKLSDFGTSKVLESEETLIIQNKSLKGTPYWMAPEVCQLKAASFESDIWSFGGVVIEMIGGLPPYADKYGADIDAYELMKKIALEEKPNYPQQTSTLATEFLDTIFVAAHLRPSASKLLQHPYVQISDPQIDSEEVGFKQSLDPVPSKSKIAGPTAGNIQDQPINSTQTQLKQLQSHKLDEQRLQKQREWELALQEELRRKSKQNL
ncbi:unnamed protein product (macronuclear) [Paramecium tetraurelia]|uniref:Protein kinase domain-containing protein n=1 Tax=Paramecium tetraurelia TaxID=5888 RepID=A0DYM0_PARTE|nr:uncharacterized protein GSPATT00003105001 [Paramecium tetraurelia]CAK88137.1 unnamed protein product [Paramecium tetraurelia]|eukprot:XP_001455534.1 hypothetical protein (macronuclear) [Paramecium tetraurelia strain d4-2]